MAETGNVVEHLVRLAASQPDQPAIIEPGGARISFAELDAATAALAGGLHARGLVPGDRLALLAPMGIDLYLGLLGLLRAGATVVLVDPSAPAERLRSNLRKVGLSGFVGSPMAHWLRLLHPPLRGLRHYLSTGFTPLPHRRLRAVTGPPLPPQAPTGPALITFTTGTSGVPRAIARSHAFLQAQHEILAGHMALGPGDVDLPTLPVFLLNSLGAGATCVLPDADLRQVSSVDPARVLAQARTHRVTTTSGSPAFYGPLVAHLQARGETWDGLERLFVGGGRVPSALLEGLVAVAPGARVEVVYGSTEAEPMCTAEAGEILALGGDAAGRGACVGPPVPGLDLRLWQPGSTTPVGPGEVGEVVVAGDHVNPRYFEDPEADARAKVALDGRVFHRTGDVARRDPEGRIWLVGRVGEEIGGAWPFEVEGRAGALPFVRRCALVEIRGEAVLACELAEPPPGWEEEVRACSGLRHVVAVQAVPVDPRHNAKVDRPAAARLAEAAWDRVAP